MRRALPLLVILALSLAQAVSGAVPPQYSFRRIGTRDGLSENNVKSIVQDHLGFIWLGTRNGLNRFDGNHIKCYDVVDNAAGCGNNNVSALFEDSQKRLWVGTDNGVYLFDSESERFTFFDTKAENTGEGITNWIAQIAADKDGNIWIVSPNEGAFCYNTDTKRMRAYSTNGGKKSYEDNPQCVLARKNGDIWLGTNGAGLYKIDIRSGRTEQFITDSQGTSLAGKNIYTMCDCGSYIAVGEHEDRLMRFDPAEKRLSMMRNSNAHYKIIRGLHYDGSLLWVATQSGLYVLDEAHGTEEHITEDRSAINSLQSNMLYSLYCDRSGNIWTGTMYDGACYMRRHGLAFNCYPSKNGGNSVGGGNLRDMAEDKYGNIWIASENGTLDKYDPRARTFTHISPSKYAGGNNRLCVMAAGGSVWAGIFKNGMDVIDAKTNALQSHYSPSELGLESEGSVYSLFKDSQNRVWLGTGRGLYIQSEGMRFVKITTLPNLYAHDIAQDRNGDIWIATMGMGIYRYTPKTGRYANYTVENTGNALLSNSVSSISTASNGDLLFSTDRGGFSVYRFKTGKFASFSKQNGLPDDVTYKILDDGKRHLWFGTNHGLTRFDIDSGNADVFTDFNGLFISQYGYKAAIKTCAGTLLFGGTDGLVEVDTRLLARRGQGQRIFITDIKADNKRLTPEKGGVLETNILYADKIRLPYDMASIELQLSSLDFSETSASDVEYMLVGQDESWNTVQNGKNIYYSRLHPGSYTLKARHKGDEDNITELNIQVAHPWWDTVWARFFYILAVFALCYGIYKNAVRKKTRAMKAREEKHKEAKEKELLEAKIDFFTNVAHEIRTPLTLINGAVENVQEAADGNAATSKSLAAIAKNSRRLTNLVSQLLDFRKVEANATKLNITNADLCKLLANMTERFEPAIIRMGKTISLSTEYDSMTVPMDVEAVVKIVSNLLNNALKYSDSFIQVDVTRTEEAANVTVTNDGDKIPADKAEAVFTPFQRLEKHSNTAGTGIGLALARSLAELHKGRLTPDTSSEYNKFVLSLPLHQDNVTEDGDPSQAEQDLDSIVIDSDDTAPEYSAENDKEYTVLVVEDNCEMMRMISDKLNTRFNVETATDGKLALELLGQKHVDIIVSDVMMPVMDGLQLTAHVKENMETSHIPVILLTAKTALQSQIEGLKAGADAYIEKPFSSVHLITQIETLLNNRKRERDSFLQKPYLPVQNSTISKAEENFISKASDLIIKNINDSAFNVEQLASELCMSRSSLHRKIKEVSNLTPIDFIRLIRLKKAAELIAEYDYRTNEVCEMVGINSPSYFIKLFQKQFGMTPKEFANQRKAKSQQ